ncbi:MAG: hypothetical protein KatS3mg131_3823 [Candidatus Tectimicrobiota bacterium]|nr:MAG: hypothetical protein KatS3mg131_3823 [Candidatus Tectomicrobia bacterium]
MVYLIASFNFNLDHFPSLAAAEEHYRTYHVPLARRLPGLRRYLIGQAISLGPLAAPRHRAAILAFDSAEALRAAYRSEVGRALREDEKRLIADAFVTLIEGEEIVGP